MCDKITEKKIWWSDANISFTAESHEVVRQRAIDYINTRQRVFVVDGWGGWDPQY